MYHNLKLKNINLFDQHVNQKKIIKGLSDCYSKYAFSTFPYIIDQISSKDAIKKYNSGNCIALSLSLKDYFEKKNPVKPKLKFSCLVLNITNLTIFILVFGALLLETFDIAQRKESLYERKILLCVRKALLSIRILFRASHESSVPQESFMRATEDSYL